jgi:hypothetical protein
MVWTKGGITCIYAGPREQVSGARQVIAKRYGSFYKRIEANPGNWVKMENGSFWRVRTQGSGAKVTPGTRVALESAAVEHNLNGMETSTGEYHQDSTFEVTKEHYIYQVGPNIGAIVEVAYPEGHRLFKVDLAK